MYCNQGVAASCEIVNCNSVEIQCEVDSFFCSKTNSIHPLRHQVYINSWKCVLFFYGTVGFSTIDNTSCCQLYLSKESLGASITTTKSSEINALIPDANGDGDWVSNSLIFTFGHFYFLCTTRKSWSGRIKIVWNGKATSHYLKCFINA
jgi:adenylyl cyclase-associated protein